MKKISYPALGLLCLWVLLCVCVCGCATVTPEGARVVVYQAPLDALPPQRAMPKGCRLLDTRPPITMTELDLEGQKDPFWRERSDAALAGANALLILRRITEGRRDSECTVGPKITDCPPSFGAWFRVVIESYECNIEALHALAMMPAADDRTIRIDPPRRRNGVRCRRFALFMVFGSVKSCTFLTCSPDLVVLSSRPLEEDS